MFSGLAGILFFFRSGGWRSGGSAGVKIFFLFFSSYNSNISILNSEKAVTKCFGLFVFEFSMNNAHITGF